MHCSEAAHAEAQARLLLRPPSPGHSTGGAGLLGVLDFRSCTAAGGHWARMNAKVKHEACRYPNKVSTAPRQLAPTMNLCLCFVC